MQTFIPQKFHCIIFWGTVTIDNNDHDTQLMNSMVYYVYYDGVSYANYGNVRNSVVQSTIPRAAQNSRPS